jgi:adenylate cyclase
MSRLLGAAGLGFLVATVGVALSFFQFAQDIEEQNGLGGLFRFRGPRPPPPGVVIVSVGSDSAQRLQVSHHPDKWPRALHARLVDTLHRAGARVIVFDLYFTEPGAADDDQAFAEAISRAGNVVLAEPLKVRTVPSANAPGAPADAHRIVEVVKPIAVLAQAAAATAPFVLPRIPVEVHQYWTFQPSAGDAPTFPVVALQLYASREYEDLVRLVARVRPAHAAQLPRTAPAAITATGATNAIRRLRSLFEDTPALATMAEAHGTAGGAAREQGLAPLVASLVHMYGGSNRRYLNYYGPPRTIPTIPFYKVLSGDSGVSFVNTAVFVGLSHTSSTETEDSYYTVFSHPNVAFIGGVEIAATAFANLLEDTPVRPIDSRRYLLVIAGWGVLLGVVCRLSPALVAAPAVVALGVLYFLGAAGRFAADGTWYPVVVPVYVQTSLAFAGTVLWSYIEVNRERRAIRRALGYYVPHEVVQVLARNVVDMKRAGQTVYGACLFTDAAGYTSVSEHMSPQQLSEFMHQYFEAVFEPITRNGGQVVALEGDAILAIWKAARPEAALRERACQAALDIVTAVRQFNESFAAVRLPTRVGVHAGPIFLGPIGAGELYRYGPTGDTVNTASRMDGLNKFLGTSVLVSADVVDGLQGFLTREAGRFQLKGKSQAIAVCELVCRTTESDARQRTACALFSTALHAFSNRQWAGARDRLLQFIELSGADRLSHMYLELCEQYEKNPPGEAWEGIIQLTEK